MGVLDGDDPLLNPIVLFIIQLMLIIVLSRFLGKILQYFKQPMVIAEMIAGILLGPSAFGLFPEFKARIFPDSSLGVIRVMANFGLILFMFLVGLELEPDILKKSMAKYTAISTIGVIVPFVCSIPVAVLLHNDEWAGENGALGNFILFVGIAMGISALPVLARILAERHMLQQPLGVVTMAATAIDDLEGWILLAIVVAVARASDKLNILYTVLLTLGNLLVLFFGVRPILVRISKRVEATRKFSADLFFIVLVLLFVFSIATDIIGLSAIFGAFEVGCVVPRNGKMIGKIVDKLEDIITIVFLPLYFTLSGLRTEFGLLDNGYTWGIFTLVFVVAFVSKTIGCGVAGKLIGKLSWKESLCFGIFMQTKGLVALVVFNLGLDYQVITPKMFSINVAMVLLSTLCTSPMCEAIFPAKKAIQDSLLANPSENFMFSAVMCPSKKRNARNMVSFMDAVVSGRDKYSTNVTAFNVIDEDQSNSYVTSWIYEKKQHFNPPLLATKLRAKEIGCKVTCIPHIGSDIQSDISFFMEQKKADLLLLGGSEGSDDPFDSPLIQYAIKNIHADIAILINKRAGSIKLRRVLVPVYGGPNDEATLKYARMMSETEGVQVTLFHLHAATDHQQKDSLIDLCTAQSNMKYKSAGSTDIKGLSEEFKAGYDWILMGAGKEVEGLWNEPSIPVTVIFDANRLGPKNNSTKWTPEQEMVDLP